MTIRIGVNPIAWSNDDKQELGGHIPLETCLSEARQAGYAGIELGHKFPRDAATLRPILEAHDIDLVGGWYSTQLLRRSVADEIAAMRDHLQLLLDMNCSVFILAETSNAIHGDQSAGLSRSPLLTAAEMTAFCHDMSELCAYIHDQGLVTAYHHHMGTVIETPAQIAAFMEQTSDRVGFLLDTGHATFGTGDPAALARTYASRITHLHCKDIRRPVLDAKRKADSAFLDAVVDGVFTVPGDGSVDYPPVLDALKAANFAGWIVVEAEQDPDKANPLEYTSMGYRNLSKMIAEAGFTIQDKA
ncbi:MAG: myo-inosose-2 dehydratase [Rhodospirillales bacterium]|nr:myo-inosose-2 dehydratase [Rhodospirillales bacterium]